MFFTPCLGTKRGTEFPCPAGTYNNRTGLERKEDCVPCITGHYCPQGTTNPKQCPRGTFNDVLSAKVLKKINFHVMFWQNQLKIEYYWECYDATFGM